LLEDEREMNMKKNIMIMRDRIHKRLFMKKKGIS
jgi:hypothetical protein